MANHSEIESIIFRQLSGNATAEDDTRVESWLQESEANREEYDRFEKAWELAEISEPVDVESEWVRFQQKHFKETKVVDLHRRDMRTTQWYSYAAAIAILISLALGGWYFAGDDSYLTAPGERQLVELSDGTQIILTGESELEVPRTFGWWNRELSLQGEAIFDVAENPDKPFSIEGPLTNTQVLGTSFRLVASTKENLLEVAEGKVAYWTDDREKALIVTAGEMAMLKNGELKETPAEGLNYDSWKTGRFRFENTPILEVLTNLQDYYLFNIDNLKKFEEVDCRFTGEFNQVELEEALEELALTMGMEYELDENTVVIQKFHCN